MKNDKNWLRELIHTTSAKNHFMLVFVQAFHTKDTIVVQTSGVWLDVEARGLSLTVVSFNGRDQKLFFPEKNES